MLREMLETTGYKTWTKMLDLLELALEYFDCKKGPLEDKVHLQPRDFRGPC